MIVHMDDLVGVEYIGYMVIVVGGDYGGLVKIVILSSHKFGGDANSFGERFSFV